MEEIPGVHEQTGVRVAVVGAGYWDKNLVRNFANLEALAAVCDSDAERLRHLLWYHPAVLRLKELIRAGELGRI